MGVFGCLSEDRQRAVSSRTGRHHLQEIKEEEPEITEDLLLETFGDPGSSCSETPVWLKGDTCKPDSHRHPSASSTAEVVQTADPSPFVSVKDERAGYSKASPPAIRRRGSAPTLLRQRVHDQQGRCDGPFGQENIHSGVQGQSSLATTRSLGPRQRTPIDADFKNSTAQDSIRAFEWISQAAPLGLRGLRLDIAGAP